MNMNQEEPSRRQHKHIPEPKGPKTLTVLLLLLNTTALACLLFLNFQNYGQSERQDARLDTVEYKIDALAQGLTTKQTQPSSTTNQSSSSSTTDTTQETTQALNSSSDEGIVPNEEQETTPSSSEEAAAHTTPESTSYTVKSGDTLSTIAEQHNLTVAELMSKNGLSDSTLFIDQELSLK
ncbi:LysM peptidoglycan-binding domain-containing protein [Enterococcus sp. LJL99]